MGFLFFLILSLVFGVILVLSILSKIASFVVGKPSGGTTYSSHKGNSYRDTSSHNDYHSSKDHKKVFSKDEGEYVTFEEIKGD